VLDKGAERIINDLINAHTSLAVAYENTARRMKVLMDQKPDPKATIRIHALWAEANREAERNRKEADGLHMMRLRLS
jgi:hypothetical protein